MSTRTPESSAGGSRWERLSRTQRSVEQLRRFIIEHCPTGCGIGSQDSLANELGVSRTTIRRALERLVAEGWLARAVNGNDYVATRPDRPRLRISALLLPVGPEDLVWQSYCRETFLGISREAQRCDRSVLTVLGSWQSLRHVRASLFWSPRVRAADSSITLDIFDQEFLGQLAGIQPVVCLDAPCSLPNVSSAVVDHRLSVRMAFKHLLDIGHRRIGFVGPSESKDPAAIERFDSFRDCFAWSGLPSQDQWVCQLPPGAPADVRGRYVERLIGLPLASRPTALIVVDLVFSILVELLSRGVRVPEQMSLINIGGGDVLADVTRQAQARRPLTRTAVRSLDLDMCKPNWNLPSDVVMARPTMIELPFEEMGRWAVTEVVRRLDTPAPRGRPGLSSRPAPEHRVFAPSLAPGSTTCAPSF